MTVWGFPLKSFQQFSPEVETASPAVPTLPFTIHTGAFRSFMEKIMVLPIPAIPERERKWKSVSLHTEKSNLGYLFELPGFQPCAQFNLGKNFSEEMMVLNNFSSEQMDAFLAFFREEAIPSVSLKAMLTPVTQHWSSIQLHDELTKEHTMMHKK